MTLHCGNVDMGEGLSAGYWRTKYAQHANSGVFGCYIYFTHGATNKYVDIYMSQSGFWSSGQFRLHSTYSHGNQSGYARTFDWEYNRNGTSAYGDSFQENTPGGMSVASTDFSVAQWAYDSGNTRHYMRISKSNGTGNSAYMQMHLDQNASTYMASMSMGSLQ